MSSLADRIAATEYAKLLAERKAIAQDNHSTERKSVEGLGQLRARISMREYEAVRIRYAPDYNGGNCWSDQEFVRCYLRDNAHARVKTTHGTRGQELPK